MQQLPLETFRKACIPTDAVLFVANGCEDASATVECEAMTGRFTGWRWHDYDFTVLGDSRANVYSIMFIVR